METKQEIRKCDVCDKNEPVGVASSTLGAISLAYCRECLNHNADAEFLFEMTHWTCGTEVADHVKRMNTYKDDKYISWEEWAEKYGEASTKHLNESYERDRKASEEAEKQENDDDWSN